MLQLAPQLALGPDPLHVEPGSHQPVADVGGIEAHVVALPERLHALVGRRDRRVLVRLLPPEVERHHHEAPTTWRGDAGELAHRARVVLDVLEHV